MRSVALGLLAAAGCNQIWGIDRVARDNTDAPPSDPRPRIRLTMQIAQTDPATGNPDQNLVYGPISPPPAVQIGTLDGPLMDAVYEVDGMDPGKVAFPPEYLGTTWRLVYTLDDGLPREVHWAPAATLAGHIVEPLLGRVARAPVPTGGGYTITPPNLAANFQHTASRLYTTGIWTAGSVALPPAGRTFDYVFAQNATSLSGPLGAPEQGKLDHAVLADFKVDLTTGCLYASGTATFPVPDLVAGSLSSPAIQPTYYSADKQVTLNLPGVPAPIHARIQTVLGSRASATPDKVRWEYGYAPSLGVFGFSKAPVDKLGEFLLPGPRMIAFLDCAYEGNTMPMSPPYADSTELRMRFPRVVHIEIVSSRTVSSVALNSGFSAVVSSSTDAFISDFSVAAATEMKLQRGGAPIADLADAPDGQTLPAGAGPLELTFKADPENAALVADYFDVTLHRVANMKLDAQRIYTITTPRLTIDPSFLVPNTEYVFEIRSYRGRPDVARTNFSINSYPQYVARIFTRTFRTPP